MLIAYTLGEPLSADELQMLTQLAASGEAASIGPSSQTTA
jgi:hypothetical protein